MELDEYGFIIELIETTVDADTSTLHQKHFYYPASRMKKFDGLLTLKHNGVTLADVGVVWGEPQTKEDPVLRFDAYNNLLAGKDREYFEVTIDVDEKDQDVCRLFLNWVLGVAARNEKPLLVKAISEILCT